MLPKPSSAPARLETIRSPKKSPLYTVIPKTPTATKVVFCFGRFQPPTIGHRHLFETVKHLAGNDADYFLFPSAQCDALTTHTTTSTTTRKTTRKTACPDVKNPLTLSQRIHYLKKIFPQDQHRILDIAKVADVYQRYDPPTRTKTGKLKETPKSFATAIRAFVRMGYTDITEVFAGDEYKNFEKSFKPSMQKDLDAEFGTGKATLRIHWLEREEGRTATTNDPTIATVSGTQMRNAVKDCKPAVFAKGVPSPTATFTTEDRMSLFYSLRRAIGKTYQTDLKDCPPMDADISPKKSMELLKKVYDIYEGGKRASKRSKRSTMARNDSTNKPAK